MASGPAVAGPAAVLINPRARRGLQARASLVRRLRAAGVDVRHVTLAASPARIGMVTSRWLDRGIARIIVGGGDGTIGAVAARMAEVAGVTLGLIPLGTANDFARTLDIPPSMEAAVAIAAGDYSRPIDLGRANDAYFLNVASLGMSVAATEALSPWLKRWLGPTAYAVAGARAFFQHPTFRVRIEAGGDRLEGEAHQVVVGNGRFYGGGVLVSKRSTLDDGLLAAYALGASGRWELLHTIARLRLRIPIERPGDLFVSAAGLRVETTPRLGVNLDGEIRTTTPVTFAVVPGALRVLVAPPEPGGA